MDIFNGFQCVRDHMINIPGVHLLTPNTNSLFVVSCQPNHISINNHCYPVIGIGEACEYDQQCRTRTNLVGNVACINGVCQQIGGGVRPRDQGGTLQ